MPGHASSPYWTAVDFDSEGDEEPSPHSSQRIYVDPWDSEQYSFGRVETGDSSLGENFNSLAGEPVSASFYYVPTKNYDSDEEAGESSAMGDPRRMLAAVEGERTLLDYSQARRRSRAHDHHPDMTNYGYDVTPIQNRRRSVYNPEEPYYTLHPMVYEPVYHHLPLPLPMIPPPGALLPPPMTRKRVSLPASDYVTTAMKNGKHRRPSRHGEACDRYAYETLMAEYGVLGPGAPPEEWRRPALPKAAPENFHLSRYGHLKIDYSCSWSSLDRLIRNQ